MRETLSTSRPELGIGLIGTGFMGRAHALAFGSANAALELPARIRLAALADADSARAEHCAQAWGFDRSHADWQQLIDDPQVHIVAITTPNHLHFPMAMAAIAAGKAVYCEKPLAVSLAEANEMRLSAKAAGVVTQVGYNYQHNPVIGLAREMIEAGELGDIVSFQGEFSEDFMGNPTSPWSWRCEPAHAGGALADLGSHLLAMARYLMGDVEAVCADASTVHRQRPASLGSSEMRTIAVDDQTHALLRFANGARGTFSSSWLKHGYKNHLSFEISGTQGTLAYDQERLNELRIYRPGAPGRDGFQRLLAGPALPGYAAFCPAPGHQLGYNELKALEVQALILAVCGQGSHGPDFEEAWQIERLASAIRRAATEQRWVALADI
ncbi:MULTISPECIES: Gfo/Idh/MocA family protein [Pseudomonas syringae group]|uniref:1-carboxy-3-chloro-3,4-dihydroxycyclo hexa-1,5-diene dehydrogenase n=3 Tax=Pseudomonas TaxID=286 RepID=A0ABR5JFN6_9PSED|nr:MULTISPECIES: Gfo/Idh/MocA family oxidoreductase [Pseudomonas syringae group]KOP51357.1 1-carboxy-3-chloro-3,4-dihydroxycyclo hexa-1,5-diene dehydrogenase [Pseudomonas coronafaciens pv. porri]KOP57005.1 1-carboxy-3-chloro-3,4-dihydroxycyclo hexa-1,5-diene dehydrogenase [Pseudomonas coronafaciens pv. porri]KPY19158.1 Gfo/Idh/MocA family oxidoreductase [Pseudomonas coronafaciens pv. porri]MCF5803664.1 gfo/Idh/MocA family oxidoreductase [Pseudomonas tremae]MCF5808296.1 gfo/Idh/MocA family oxid